MTTLLTTAQVAEVLHLNRKTVERLVHRGQLEPIAQAPGRNGALFFTPEAVATYGQAHPLTAVVLDGVEPEGPVPA